MTTKILTLSLGFAALLAAILAADPSHAQQAQNCAPHDAVVARLAAGYGETRQSIGIGSNNTVVEVFASSETGTWSITVTGPEGPTCLVASGQAFQILAEALPNTDPGA